MATPSKMCSLNFLKNLLRSRRKGFLITVEIIYLMLKILAFTMLLQGRMGSYRWLNRLIILKDLLKTRKKLSLQFQCSRYRKVILLKHLPFCIITVHLFKQLSKLSQTMIAKLILQISPIFQSVKLILVTCLTTV